jgi:hypothetical protein
MATDDVSPPAPDRCSCEHVPAPLSPEGKGAALLGFLVPVVTVHAHVDHVFGRIEARWPNEPPEGANWIPDVWLAFTRGLYGLAEAMRLFTDYVLLEVGMQDPGIGVRTPEGPTVPQSLDAIGQQLMVLHEQVRILLPAGTPALDRARSRLSVAIGDLQALETHGEALERALVAPPDAPARPAGETP